MKSLLSLLVALLVLLALVAGGYWLYQRASGGNSGPSGRYQVLRAPGGDTTLTLTNGTHYILTVTMRQGTELIRFEIVPGRSETKPLAGGTYAVEGKISDPDTDPFSSSWTIKSGGHYNANFSVDRKTGQIGVALLPWAPGNQAPQSGPSPNRGRPGLRPLRP